MHADLPVSRIGGWNGRSLPSTLLLQCQLRLRLVSRRDAAFACVSGEQKDAPMSPYLNIMLRQQVGLVIRKETKGRSGMQEKGKGWSGPEF